MSYEERSTTIDGWRFKRVSSEYIDVFPPGSRTPVDCINVYDHEKGESRIPNGAKAHRAEAERWFRENRGDLHHYIEMARTYR